MVVIILGFYLLLKRGKRLQFETEDFFQRDRRRERTPYPSDGKFREKRNPSPNETLQRNVLIAIILAIFLIGAVAVIFGIYEILLLIFMLPLIIRVVRSRRDAKRE